MKPNVLDPVMPYTDFIINMFLLTFASWVSPGTYLITLWLTYLLWVVLLYMNTRMNVLRWQARTYFGSKRSHRCESFLLAIPLGFLCAALDHQVNIKDHSGMMGLIIHTACHFVFVQYILGTIELPRKKVETTYEQMMQHDYAPVGNYLNTNPIEVLRTQYKLPDSYPTPLIFYRNDKWYLQQTHCSSQLFVGEDAIAIGGVWSATKVEAQQFAKDIVVAGVTTGKELRHSFSNWNESSPLASPTEGVHVQALVPDREGLTSAASHGTQVSGSVQTVLDRTNAVDDHLGRLMGRPLSG